MTVTTTLGPPSPDEVVIVPSTGQRCHQSWLPRLFAVLDRDFPGSVTEAMSTAVTENARREVAGDPADPGSVVPGS